MRRYSATADAWQRGMLFSSSSCPLTRKKGSQACLAIGLDDGRIELCSEHALSDWQGKNLIRPEAACEGLRCEAVADVQSTYSIRAAISRADRQLSVMVRRHAHSSRPRWFGRCSATGMCTRPPCLHAARRLHRASANTPVAVPNRGEGTMLSFRARAAARQSTQSWLGTRLW